MNLKTLLAAVTPCHGTGEITVTLLTHSFDDDSVIPTSHFSLQFRLIIYRESLSATSEKLFNEISYTNNDRDSPAIKRSGVVLERHSGDKITRCPRGQFLKSCIVHVITQVCDLCTLMYSIDHVNSF